jgi:DNA-binding XRE family transcriptional regulator
MTYVMVEPTASAVGFGVKMGMTAVQEKIKRLKAVRQALGWSEEVCAYHLGVTYSTLNRWERGESLPKSRLVLAAIDRFISRHTKGQIGRG